MPRTLLAVAVVLLALPCPSFAGPPGMVPGEMVLDQVAEGLRRYRKERDETRRLDSLGRLASTKDPRVAVVLGELACDQDDGLAPFGVLLLAAYYVPRPVPPGASDEVFQVRSVALRWWCDNEADLRRRARQLP